MAGYRQFQQCIEEHGDEASVISLRKEKDTRPAVVEDGGEVVDEEYDQVVVTLKFPDGFERDFHAYGSDIVIFEDALLGNDEPVGAYLVDMGAYFGAILLW